MKYKPKSEVKTVVSNNQGRRTTEEQRRPTKPSYARALKSNTKTFEKSNLRNHHENKPKININERLRSLTPVNRRPKQGIIRSRNNWKLIYHLIKNKSKKLNNLRENWTIETNKERSSRRNNRNKNIQHTCWFKKKIPGLCVSRGPRRKHQTDQSHKLNQTNHNNLINLPKTLDFNLTLQDK